MEDDPLEQLTHDEKERLADLVKGNTSRRDMLKAGGALGVGAILGGGGYAASTQSAKADASTSDSDGDVGTPSNRVDVFSDGVDANSVKTPDVNNEKSVDPPGTNLQTVIDDVASRSTPAKRGLVKLKPETAYSLSDIGTITVKEGVHLDLNGARINADIDQDIFVQEGATRIFGPGTIATFNVTYTSNVFTVDAANYGNMRLEDNSNAEIIGLPMLRGVDGEGTALYINGGSNTVYFNRYELAIRGYNNPIKIDTEGNVNSNIFSTIIKGWGNAAMYKRGGGPCTNAMYGDLQPDVGSTNYFDLGGTGSGKLNFYGYLWDTGNLSGEPFPNGSYNVNLHQSASPSQFTNGAGETPAGTNINGVAWRSLSGDPAANLDTSDYDVGVVVNDIDNPGNLYKIYDNDISDGYDRIFINLGTTNSVSPGFDTWTQASANFPAMLEIATITETDGNNTAQIRLNIDESGGTTSDYFIQLGYTDSGLGSGIRQKEATMVYLPPGSQYEVANVTDPNGNNTIEVIREFIM